MIKGIDVILYEKRQTGVDALNAPVYEQTPVTVSNVLVTPQDSVAIAEDFRLYGKRLVYELCIPKGDTHNWTDTRVDFFGESFGTFGMPREYIEANVPLAWNRKVKVELLDG